ncbi:MAG: isoaspartyl peptidase/L-asparaginase family protein [Tsuneonella sp.]
MRNLVIALMGLATFIATPLAAQEKPVTPNWSFAIHGGAGVLKRSSMTPEQQAEYKAALQVALDAGAKVLRDGGAALDAVTAAITILEDDPRFNAGRGAVFTWDGTNELDASIMDGNGRKAGAVSGVKVVRNPILLARAVMDDGRHVMLSGTGAEEFARDRKLEIVPPEYFATDFRRGQLEELKANKVSALEVEFKFGTVGAVARDSAGHLAAGTSTGGMTGKRWGRIGDAPIIGAGTYADDTACAVSATGSGEYFIRVAVAHSICERVRTARRLTLDGETRQVPLTDDVLQGIVDGVMAEVGELGGSGGVIVAGPEGAPVFSMNSAGMYRGRATADGINEVAIFSDE